MIHIFVVNPIAGTGEFVTELRDQIPQEIESYIFTTTRPGGEADVVKQARRIFDGEELRFYCCGGSGTFCNSMNALDEIGELEKTELAFIPYGMTNDFLKVFGKAEEKFKDVASMINGDVINIDYIRTNHGVALNSLSGGLDTALMSDVEKYRLASTFAKTLPYIIGFFSSVFLSKPLTYSFRVDGNESVGKFCEIYVGNGGTIGGFFNVEPSPIVTDGMAHFFVPPNKRGLSVIRLAKEINSHKVDPAKRNILAGKGRSFNIKREDGLPFDMNLDGEVIHGFNEWEAHIVEKGLKFIVPKGVRADGL